MARLRGAAPGLLLLAIGSAALAACLALPFQLPSGRPGAGFVPALIATALGALGAMLALAGAAQGAAAEGVSPRPGLVLLGAVLGFGLLLPVAGFLPAAWAAGTLALLAAPGLSVVVAAAGGGGLALGAAVLFLGLLGIPAPLIGPR